jgi:membrane protein
MRNNIDFSAMFLHALDHRSGVADLNAVHFLARSSTIAIVAFRMFLVDEGWAIASYIALTTLMALFPFLIVITALAAFFGSRDLADEAARILLEAWPKEVAVPIAGEIHRVLTTTRGGVLTLGVIFAVYFSSSGIDSLRIGLNRAYSVTERRSWWLLRLESIAYVLVGAAALIALSLLVVLGPVIVSTAVRYAPWLEPLEGLMTFARLAVASLVLGVALLLVHLWLPAGRRGFFAVLPGVIATLALWLALGAMFGRYLAEFAQTYVSTYAGLASAMIALVFLYWTASIFIYGGELNAAIAHERATLAQSDPAGGTGSEPR